MTLHKSFNGLPAVDPAPADPVGVGLVGEIALPVGIPATDMGAVAELPAILTDATVPLAATEDPVFVLGGDILTQLVVEDGTITMLASLSPPHPVANGMEADNVDTAPSRPGVSAQVGGRVLAVFLWFSRVIHRALRYVFRLGEHVA